METNDTITGFHAFIDQLVIGGTEDVHEIEAVWSNTFAEKTEVFLQLKLSISTGNLKKRAGRKDGSRRLLLK